MQVTPNTALQDACQRIHATAGDRDQHPAWPAEEWKQIVETGFVRGILPTEFSGTAYGQREILAGYRTIASASLTLALILTQRDAAVDLIARGVNAELKATLPQHADGQLHTTVGISQITTSKGAARPKLRATPDGEGFRLDGLMPWVTGAHHADNIVTAAVMEDGRQLLAAVPRDADGLRPDPPMHLLALEASGTCVVHCDGVHVPPAWLVKPPTDAALTGRAPVKGLTVTGVGLGLSDRLVLQLQSLRAKTPDEVWEPTAQLIAAHARVAAAFEAALERVEQGEVVESTPHRVAVNDILSRLAVALLNVGKGSGYVRGTEPERLVREALFFQVWSIPDPVRAETLAALAGGLQD